MNSKKFLSLFFCLMQLSNLLFAQQKKPIFLAEKFYVDNQQKKPLYQTQDLIQALVPQPATDKYSFTLGGQRLEYPTQALPFGLWAGYSWLNLTPVNFNPSKNTQHLRFAEWVSSQYLLKDTGRVIVQEMVLDINYPQSRYKISTFNTVGISADTERKGLEQELRRLTEDSTNAAYLLASAKTQQKQYAANSEQALSNFKMEVVNKSKEGNKWVELAELNQQISRELVIFQQNQDTKAAYKIGDLTSTREKLLNSLRAAEPDLLPLYENSQLLYSQTITNELNIKVLEERISTLAEALRLLRLRLN